MNTKKDTKKRGAPTGNQNARLGKHEGIVLRLPVELVDDLYECLAREGEIIADDDPQRIREFALSIIGGYVRRHIEDSRAIIL